MKNNLETLCAVATLLLVGHASASTTWTLNTGAVTSAGVSVTSEGWANTSGSGAGTDSYALQLQTAGTNLQLYSGGLGINNLNGCASGTACDEGDVANTAPEHAIDNQGRYEMVLLSFTSLVNLTNFKIGWPSSGYDSDMTVLAYTGAGTPATLAGQKWSDLAASSSGWGLIGNYLNVSTSAAKPTNSAVYSSYWLIGAYNPLVAAGSYSGYAGNDYIKLASVIGNVCTGGSGPGCTPPSNDAPEPGSLALFGLGLLGMIGFRRRQRV